VSWLSPVTHLLYFPKELFHSLLQYATLFRFSHSKISWKDAELNITTLIQGRCHVLWP
jgi:hypothetical protein